MAARVVNLSLMEKAVDAAQSFLEFRILKPFQRSALTGMLQGRDIFVSQPTGSGKSAIYQLAPVVFDLYDRLLSCEHDRLPSTSFPQTEELISSMSQKSQVLVIQPLISLIEDQMNKFSGGKIKVSRLRCERELSSSNTTAGGHTKGKSDQENFPTSSQIIFASPEAVLDTHRSFLDPQLEYEWLQLMKLIV
eukprot:Seg6359.1 transcript_id=Seg6359.1/GoldUCD/mRNA.D3Y31 product="ATP-dependent helicase SGS1" protein_id=Seg6359.1/GoldUCD/D3Y31